MTSAGYTKLLSSDISANIRTAGADFKLNSCGQKHEIKLLLYYSNIFYMISILLFFFSFNILDWKTGHYMSDLKSIDSVFETMNELYEFHLLNIFSLFKKTDNI